MNDPLASETVTVSSSSTPGGQRKVHFNEDTEVQFLGDYTCIRTAGDGLDSVLGKEFDAHGQLASCLGLDAESRHFCQSGSSDHDYGDQLTEPPGKGHADIVACGPSDHQVYIELDTGQLGYGGSDECCKSPLSSSDHCQDNAFKDRTFEDIAFCSHCDVCTSGLASNFITKLPQTAGRDSPGPLEQSSGHVGNERSFVISGNGSAHDGTTCSNGTRTNENNFYSFIPFLLVTGILSITLALLVSVSIIYVQYLPLQDKVNLGYEGKRCLMMKYSDNMNRAVLPF
ncbi:hypothetical protein HDE_10335 [Halotydeus destructor]|nr:hypothetical protein HDE_10335 [Halotydeus destructor]